MRTLPGGSAVSDPRPAPITRRRAAFAAFAALASIWAAPGPALADPGHSHDAHGHDGGCAEHGTQECCVMVQLPRPGDQPWEMPPEMLAEVAAANPVSPAQPGDWVTYCGAAGTAPLLALVEAAIVESEWAEAEALSAAASRPAAEPSPPACDPRSRFWVWNDHGFDFRRIRRAAGQPDGEWWERLGPRLDPPVSDEGCRTRLWGWTGEEHSELSLVLHDLRLAPSKPQGRPDWDPLEGEQHGDRWLEMSPNADGDYRFDKGG